MLRLAPIHEHTIDLSCLTGGIVIDGGCRGFLFSKEMASLGEKVYAFDPDELNEPVPTGVNCIKAAIMNHSGYFKYVKTNDPNAGHIAASSHSPGVTVEAVSLSLLYSLLGNNIDIAKFDIEAAEYLIFSDPKLKPVPKCLSIEWHEHTQPILHNEMFEVCLSNIKQHYEPVRLDRHPAHGLGNNIWDSCFVRRDIYAKY